jgi:ABC-type transport system involved in cytochrome c biogenesis permease subunit
MKARFFAFVIIAVLAIYAMIRDSSTDYQVEGFNIAGYGQLPVQVYGRITPLDTAARNSLLAIAKEQSVVRPDGVRISAIEWLMDLVMRPELADDYPVFKIEFPDELGFVGLARSGQRHYSFNELAPFFAEISSRFERMPAERQLRNAIDNQIAGLHHNLTRYHRLMHSFHPVAGGPERLDALIDEYATYRAILPAGLEAIRKQAAGQDYDALALNRFAAFAEDYIRLSQTAYLRSVPPPPPATPLDDWQTVGLNLLNRMQGAVESPFVMGYATLTASFRAGDATTFNQTVERMQREFAAIYPKHTGKVYFEWLFNTFQPFSKAIALYVLLLIVVLCSWLRWGQGLQPAVFWLLVMAFVIHTAGLLARMYISGRPPVTNLYSSAIFVGWGATTLALIMERFYRNGFGAGVAALIGICTLIIAHNLGLEGDTLELMRAVLDSNFWLATHVIIITLGYSAMFLAGALGMLFFIKGVFVESFDQAEAKNIAGMVYGIICFALLFNVVGTILGGIWADQSWGRFWGWDPKENGALMIVLMGAIVLHARWGGIARERGIMALVIAGNIITAWSWFGTNLLGVGLHSYGFHEGGFYWLRNFVISQVLLIVLGYLPFRFWRSRFGQAQALRLAK